ncbi:hypothetical protein BLX24_23350 [Arsenicibacter rosenii]|uniref:Uncharacterized protein n=1 Tax=Arsenicibacter rosenii TaxID=1750698 RepID=A0A1S2VE73_9BACT|nr:hypothetical protein BLX24_23350 [Arsenicibacter rosenii]
MRFLTKWTSNGNVAERGIPLPVSRPDGVSDLSYFSNSYGSYSRINPAISGFTSQTMTPFIDANNNGQFDEASECIGAPVLITFVINAPVSTTNCTDVTFSYVVTSSSSTTNLVTVANTNPSSSTIQMTSGDYFQVGALTTNTSVAALRFIENVAFSGPVITDMGLITAPLLTFNTSAGTYFNRTYGPYMLPESSISVVLSSTITPYLDLNFDGQYNAGTECLGKPAYLVYQIKRPVSTTIACADVTFSYTLTGNTPVPLSNTSPVSPTIILGSGGSLQFSQGTSNVPLNNLRFLEKVTYSSPVITDIGLITAASLTFSSGANTVNNRYFDRSVGPFVLPDPAVTVVISVTAIPYIDLNGDQQYNPDNECFGKSLTYVLVCNNALFTVQSGPWNSPSIWLWGRVPDLSTPVTISHTVTVPNYVAGQAKQVSYGPGGRILFQKGSLLRLGGEPCNPMTADPHTLLTQNTWQVDELRSMSNNVIDYYKRGATTGNTSNYDNSNIYRFFVDGTGEYTNDGIVKPITWNFVNAERTKVRITESATTYNWENLILTPFSLEYTEYANRNGSNLLGQIRRTVR